MSRSKGQQFINALSKIDQYYAPNKEWDSEILINEKIKYIKLYNLGADGCKYLAQAKWNNLRKLNLGKDIVMLDNDTIGNKGCNYLKKANWKNLTAIQLCNLPKYKVFNEIGSEGCLHLS